MLCKDCLEKAASKLLANDVTILEYLNTQKATIPQCSISREVIRDELEMTNHKCFSALERLDCFGFVEKSSRHKASKYHITEGGIVVLSIFENKMKEVV
ncbi:MAG: hypothetical protein K0R18_176 [Bacillales bacterium]|jgi:RIO-like serine/threonine protein kinase|nr:hypothetical protein [Bacillales bacterium]